MHAKVHAVNQRRACLAIHTDPETTVCSANGYTDYRTRWCVLPDVAAVDLLLEDRRVLVGVEYLDDHLE